MPKYLIKSSRLGLGAALPTLLLATVARSQSEDEKEAEAVSRQIDKARNQIREADKALSPLKPKSPGASPSPGALPSPGASPSSTPTEGAPNPEGTTAIGNANYTFVISTPILIAAFVIVGGLALFPVVHLLLESHKKAIALGKSSFLSKLTGKFQKPQVLESDAFLHQRNFEKLQQIFDRAENIDADKFDNAEFTVFFKIKSYISRSIGEYANLDKIVELLNAAVAAQGIFVTIDSIESRNCSSAQQEVYKLANALLAEGIEAQELIVQVRQKVEEVTPRLQTEEGKAALATYVAELEKISDRPLALKLLLLFKKYQLADYSVLRSVSNKISTLDKESLLDLDSLMILVMSDYEVFEKLGPILGVEPEYNRPETYSKMLQYIGLQSRHEASYQKFKEFLTVLKPWDTYYQIVLTVRKKYAAKEYAKYQIPKDFKVEPPGFAMYQKFKDSFPLLDEPDKPAKISGNLTNSADLSATPTSTLTGIK